MESENEIKRYIKSALENENFLGYEVTLTPSNLKANGYASDLIFATVSATTPEGPKKIELAIKNGKKNLIAVSEYKYLYEREDYLYEVILPEFIRFQKDNNIRDIFNSVPKCYKVISEKSAEVLVMENLRKSGYDLYDRKKPLDLNHLKMVLNEYGKLHAISFAFREKRRNDFEKIVADYKEVMIGILNESYRNLMQLEFKNACDILKERVDAGIYGKFMKILHKGPDTVLEEVLKSVEPESAILHGDCWTSNFVYKYELDDHTVPLKVAILDWQMSRLHSPVLDLSYFIYSTSSKEQLEHFDELLNTYYTSFSAFLRELGCDPEKLFPFSTLQRHWKKYSVFGVVLGTAFLHVITGDSEDLPEYDEEGVGKNITEKMSQVTIDNEAEFRKRVVAIASHHFKYT